MNVPTLLSENHDRSAWIYRRSRTHLWSLPFEVLSFITEIACLSFDFPGHDPWIFPFEMTLSHTTQYWRHIALQTPRIWTRIYLYSRFLFRVDLTKLYLERRDLSH